MSKYIKFDNKKQIPLNYNDNIGVSNRNWTKVEVALKSELINYIGISGQFPAFVSSISNESKLNGIDIKIGDNIMVVNGKNVSRACAKSVKKILKSCQEITLTVSRPDQESLAKLIKKSCHYESKQNKFSSFFNLVKKNMACISLGLVKEHRELIKNIQIENTVNYCYEIESQATDIQKIELSDYGYYSIPTSTKTSTVSSVTDLESYSSLSFKPEIEDFLDQIQRAIDMYVRPCIMLKVLTIEESLSLFQNIEKLIPITKFLDNIINSVDNGSGWYSSLKIVFDAFKVYLSGLPNAINLLEELTISNEKFITFHEKIGESCSFKIIDFLFLPLKFIQNVIDYLLNSEKINDQYCSDICLHVQKTFAMLEENLDDSITQVSDCSSIDIEFDSLNKFSLMIKPDGSDEWKEGEYLVEENQIKIAHENIKLDRIKNFKHSKNICILLIQTNDSNFFAVKFANEQDKEYFILRINQLNQN